MRMAVAGGTGLVGTMVVDAARAAGHDVTVLARSTGVDLTTGAGLDLTGVEAVIDAANVTTRSRDVAVGYFAAATTNLLAAASRAGVRHLVTLSIVGVDRVPLGYYAGKLRQEELVRAGDVPWTIVRVTQFHEFAFQVLGATKGPVALVPRMRSQPVAAREVAAHLVGLASGPVLGDAPELAGPQVREMAELSRAWLRAQRQRRLVLRVPMGAALANGGLLPTGDGPRGTVTFEQWLA